jgi:hypothetical protein
MYEQCPTKGTNASLQASLLSYQASDLSHESYHVRRCRSIIGLTSRNLCLWERGELVPCATFSSFSPMDGDGTETFIKQMQKE